MVQDVAAQCALITHDLKILESLKILLCIFSRYLFLKIIKMKNFVIIIAYSILCTQVYANSINKIIGDESFLSTYHRMPHEKDSEILRIKTHLLYAVQLLNNTTTTHLSDEQIANRKHVLLLLSEYAEAEQYPTNRKFEQERRPCFIDNISGNLCAVGYLIAQTSGLDMAKQINQQYQYAYIEEMNEPALHQWANKYGLSLKDCATIQPTYDFKHRINPEPIIDNGELNREEKFKAEMKARRLESLSKALEGKDIIIVGKNMDIGNDSVYYYHIKQLHFNNKMFSVKECHIRYFVKDSVYKYLKKNVGEVSSKKFPTDYQPHSAYDLSLEASTELTDGFNLKTHANIMGEFMRLNDSDKYWYWKVKEYDIMQKISDMPKGYTVYIDYKTSKTFTKPE